MSPAARLSDQDIMPRYRMTPSRPRPRPGPAPRGAVRLSQPGSGGKGARSKPHTFAQRAFAGAELRAVELSNLEDLEAKTRGLWWGCGGCTTRSYAKPVNALSPTLWACGKKQVERFFKLLI
jgi:hypothetical protein